MATSLLHFVRRATLNKRLPSCTQFSFFVCSDKNQIIKQFSFNGQKSNNHKKSFNRILTCVTLSGICCAFYSLEDEKKSIIYSRPLLSSVSAASIPHDVNNNRTKYNFIADVVEISAPAVVYIEIKDQRR